MKNVKPGNKHPIVVLDAGHYGSKYNRSPVVKDYYESEAMWKLTNYEKAELEKYGTEVRLTRANQNDNPSVTDRGRMAKGCDLLVSNHSNACDTESVDRPVGIYLVDDNCGAIDEQSRQVAELLSETVRKLMQTNGEAQVYSKLSGNDRDGDGKKNDDYYGVLYGAHQAGTAAIILEHSFHTNTQAAKWLLSDANLEALAKAKAAALAEYFGMTAPAEEPKPNTYTLTLPVLHKGDKGEDVRALQILLAGRGHKMVANGKEYGADGDFGTATENAVRKAQADNGWGVDGIAGPETMGGLLGLN